MNSISYKPGNSFLYRLNPLIKGGMAIAAILIFSMHPGNLAITSIFLAIGLLFCFTGKIPLSDILSSLKSIFLLLFIVGAVQGFREGSFDFYLALDSVLRIVGVFCSAGIFVTISSQSELMYFWEKCFQPLRIFGIPSRELALVMVIAVRFMPVILGELERIRMAQIARGAKLSGKTGFIESAKNLMPLLIPTLTLSIQRAGELAMAMEARGYRMQGLRTRLHVFKFRFLDFVLLIAILSAIVALFKVKFFSS